MKILAKIKNWPHLNLLILFLIMAIGSFLRLYRLEEFMWWHGDSGRDVLVAKHIIEHQETGFILPALGAEISFLKNSPLYYYFLALFWFIARSPVGITFLFSTLGILSIFCLYLAASTLFNKNVGLTAAALIAFSYQMSRYARGIFQPFLLPFFICVTFLLLIVSLKRKSFISLLLSIFFFFISIQIHYSTLLILPVFVVWSIYSLLMIDSGKNIKRLFSLLFIESYLILSALWLSLAYHPPPQQAFFDQIFPLEAMFQNFDLNGFLQRSTENLILVFNYVAQDSFQIYWLSIGLAIFTFGGLILFSIIDLFRKDNPASSLLLLSLLSMIWLSGLYENQVFDYYFTPLYPIIFISWAFLIERMFFKNQLVKNMALLILIFGVFRGNERFIKGDSPNEYGRVENVIKIIYEDSRRQKTQILGAHHIAKSKKPINTKPDFNIFVISDRDQFSWDSPPFWFLLEEKMKVPMTKLVDGHNNIEPLNPDPDYLYLICVWFETQNEAEKECLNYFLKREGVWAEDRQIPTLSEFDSHTALYRLREKPS